MLHYTRLERLDSDKDSSLLGQSLSYEENEVLFVNTDPQNFLRKNLGSKLLWMCLNLERISRNIIIPGAQSNMVKSADPASKTFLYLKQWRGTQKTSKEQLRSKYWWAALT
jgi:hypothetical protein